MQIKICGMRRQEDISYINEYLPDYAGFILTDGFRRSVGSEAFYKLKSCLDKKIKTVGVFVNEPIESIIENHYNEELDVIQLHGNEDESYIQGLRKIFQGEIWKAVRAKQSADIENADKLSCDRLLIDSYVKGQAGGTGKTADTEVILGADFSKPYMLAGGISAENAVEMLNLLAEKKPCGIDLSSSVETNGVKDKEKIRQITDIFKGGKFNG